jgi:hypothetical protein
MQIDLTAPEHKKDKEWYRSIGYYYSTFYNRPIFPVLNNETAFTPVDEMNRCELYYFGQQGAARNFPVMQNTQLIHLQSRNNQIYQLINALHGKIVEFMAKFNTAVEVLSPEAVSTREQLRLAMYFIVENKEFVDEMSKYGIVLNALPKNEEITSREDVDDYLENGYREEGAKYAERLSKAMIKINDYANMKSAQFLNVLTCGVTATDRYFKDGILIEEAKAPQSLIFDLRNKEDNCFNDKAWFFGFFDNLVTPAAILEKYGDALYEAYNGNEAIDEIKDLAQSQAGIDNSYAVFSQRYPQNATPYFSWWNSQGSTLTGMSIVKMYFLAHVDYRFRPKNGGFVKSRDYDDRGKPIPENMGRKGVVSNYRWHQVTVIGGKWVCDFGLVPNALYDQLNIGKQHCPATRYISGYTGGYYRSVVSRMIDLQDDINLAQIKIKQAELNDLGVNYIITEGGADSTKTIQDIYKDFSSQHITMLKKDLENPDVIKMMFSEVVDFTKALSVVPIYQSIIQQCTAEMSKMMHLPDVAQGLQQTTIGKGVQAASTNLAAVGVAPLFNSYVNFIQRDIQMSCNIQKISIASDDTNVDYWKIILGDAGYMWMKTAAESLEYLGIYINPYDQIDEANKARLDMKIQAAEQNGMIDFENVLKLETISSYREAVSYLKRVTKKRKQEALMMREQDRKDKMAMAQMESETRLQEKQFAPQALLASTQMKTQASKEIAAGNDATKDINNQREANVKLATHQAKD